jgi:serine phosphatase RsbU (regulator of sigma subunit)
MSPLIYRRSKHTLEEGISLKLTGFPLGMVEGMDYEFTRVQLDAGDSVIVFTDGVSDANDKNEEHFGMDRVRECILGDAAVAEDGFTPQQIGKRIITKVQAHANGAYQNDDIALVCFGRMDGPNFDAGSGRISTPTGPITQTIKRSTPHDE